jgi:hypothetical protein
MPLRALRLARLVPPPRSRSFASASLSVWLVGHLTYFQVVVVGGWGFEGGGEAEPLGCTAARPPGRRFFKGPSKIPYAVPAATPPSSRTPRFQGNRLFSCAGRSAVKTGREAGTPRAWASRRTAPPSPNSQGLARRYGLKFNGRSPLQRQQPSEGGRQVVSALSTLAAASLSLFFPRPPTQEDSTIGHNGSSAVISSDFQLTGHR